MTETRTETKTGKKAEPDVLHYSNYRTFLQDHYEFKKAEQPVFSHRYFARKAGISSPNYLKLVMDGKRNLTKKTLLKFAAALGLKGVRAEFFENLVFFNQTASLPERNIYYGNILRVRAKAGLRKLDEAQFQLFSDWRHIVVRELAAAKGFRPDARWIVKKLGKVISEKEAEESLKLLSVLGLLKRTANGFMQTDINITTSDEVRSLLVKNLSPPDDPHGRDRPGQPARIAAGHLIHHHTHPCQGLSQDKRADPADAQGTAQHGGGTRSGRGRDPGQHPAVPAHRIFWLAMGRFRKCLLAASLASILAAGCNQGTEVGNPEITIAARFSLDDSDGSVTIPEMHLTVTGMDWTKGADSGACWNEPNGYAVDLADTASQLPMVTVRNSDWDWAEMLLQAPLGEPGLPDTSAFADWSNPRYAKLIKVTGTDTLRFLFEMPVDLRINLTFDESTIQSWRKHQTITVQIHFDVGRWAYWLGPNSDYRFRLDGKRARYVLLSPIENAAVYESMKATLPSAFPANNRLY